MTEEQMIERLQTQLAACLVAANGDLHVSLVQGDYGWSPAYQKIMEVRHTYDSLRQPVVCGGKYYRHKVSGKQYLVQENGRMYWLDANDKWVHSLLTFDQLKEHFEPWDARWFKGFCGGNITRIWKFEDGVLWFWCPVTRKFRSSDFESLDNLISSVKTIQETDYDSIKGIIKGCE